MSTIPENTPAKLGPVAVVNSQSAMHPPRIKRWTREEYYRLYELGWFRDERVELIKGDIILMSPQSPEHYKSMERIRRLLVSVFGDEYWIRMQGPISCDELSEPEPDLCVVRGGIDDFEQHPTHAQLIVEISKTSLNFDRTAKLSLYASMNILDYWILDLENRQLLVHRSPVEDSQSQFGFRYDDVVTVGSEGQVSPLEKPTSMLAVAQMLPPEKKAQP